MKASGIVDMASDVVKSAVSRQDEITVVEAGNMWNKLLARYDSTETDKVLPFKSSASFKVCRRNSIKSPPG